MEQLAYEDAVDVYGRALEVLELMDDPDEALRCSLLLSLGGAEAKSARVADARAAFERAADSARRLDDTDSLVGAAIGIAMMSDAGRLDEHLLALLDESLERIGPERDRAPCGALEREVGGDVLGGQRPHRVDAPGRRGDRDRARGRRPDDARGGAAAEDLHPRRARRARVSAWRSPTRWSSWESHSGDREAVLRGHAYRLWSFLELGDIPAVDRELDLYSRLAEELRMPEHTWHTYALRGMRVLLDGEIEEAERLARGGEKGRQPGRAGDLRAVLRHPDDPDPQHAGPGEELLPPSAIWPRDFPGIPAWRGGVVTLAARSGDLELAQSELERLRR